MVTLLVPELPFLPLGFHPLEMGVAATDSASSRWGRASVDGSTSTGATMSVASGGHHCCRGGGCVNIYVNNNVQGVTNSVLLGSKVVMRDPGARVSSRRPKQEENRAALKKTAIIAILLSAAAVLCLALFIRRT
jgi:hypothetical protein